VTRVIRNARSIRFDGNLATTQGDRRTLTHRLPDALPGKRLGALDDQRVGRAGDFDPTR
jgi:hypothetical protein